MTKLNNSNCEKTQQLKLWQLKKSNCDITQKVKLWQNSIYDKSLKESFSKNNLTPRQRMECSLGSVLRFSQCLDLASFRVYTGMQSGRESVSFYTFSLTPIVSQPSILKSFVYQPQAWLITPCSEENVSNILIYNYIIFGLIWL